MWEICICDLVVCSLFCCLYDCTEGERVSHESLFEESEAPYAALCVVANFDRRRVSRRSSPGLRAQHRGRGEAHVPRIRVPTE